MFAMKKYPKVFLKGLHKKMLKMRICEESLVERILTGEIRCPVHLYSGEEAVAAGICAAISEEDYVFGTHRSHGHLLAKGGGVERLFGEVFGKIHGCSRGRGGSMHVIEPSKGLAGAVPIVAGTISLALGAALASSIKKEGRVAVSFFGDGATGEGVLYESLNFAALKKLPILFVCENNQYSTHMPIRECRPDVRIFEIGRPFGILSYQVDGNNVLRVYETAKRAVELCRNGEGPTFVECLTYRLRGHVGPDDNIQGTHTDIRPTDEVEEWRKRDPIDNFEKYLLENEILLESEIEEIKREIEKEVEEAHKFVKRSPYPHVSELTKYVFKE